MTTTTPDAPRPDIYHHLESLEDLMKILEAKPVLDAVQLSRLEEYINEIRFHLPRRRG